jgi:hypothetical protein
MCRPAVQWQAGDGFEEGDGRFGRWLWIAAVVVATLRFANHGTQTSKTTAQAFFSGEADWR